MNNPDRVVAGRPLEREIEVDPSSAVLVVRRSIWSRHSNQRHEPALGVGVAVDVPLRGLNGSVAGQ